MRRTHKSTIQAVGSVVGHVLPALATVCTDIANEPPPSLCSSRLAKLPTTAGHRLVATRNNEKAATWLPMTPVPYRPASIHKAGGVLIQITFLVQRTPVSPGVHRARQDLYSAIPGLQVNGFSGLDDFNTKHADWGYFVEDAKARKLHNLVIIEGLTLSPDVDYFM
ncbi:hypothetical protein MRX96_041706 [Rhipicephalus microplus]